MRTFEFAEMEVFGRREYFQKPAFGLDLVVYGVFNFFLVVVPIRFDIYRRYYLECISRPSTKEKRN